MKSGVAVVIAFIWGICACPLSYSSPTPAAGEAVNLSVRVELHAKPAIHGLVVDGTRVVLIRAIGPGLEAFGVPETVADPTITVVDEHGNILGRGIPMNELSDRDFELIERAVADSGAFSVPRTSRDAVFLLPIGGIVTAKIESASSTPGEVLVEAYILPWTEYDRGTRVFK